MEKQLLCVKYRNHSTWLMRLNSSFVRGSKLGFQHSSLNSLHDVCQRKQRLNLLLKLVVCKSHKWTFEFCPSILWFLLKFQFCPLCLFPILNFVHFSFFVPFSIVSNISIKIWFNFQFCQYLCLAHMKISILFYYSDILVIENERILEINKSCKLNLAEKRKGRLESD